MRRDLFLDMLTEMNGSGERVKEAQALGNMNVIAIYDMTEYLDRR